VDGSGGQPDLARQLRVRPPGVRTQQVNEVSIDRVHGRSLLLAQVNYSTGAISVFLGQGALKVL
jgi:hypothetical protein